MAGRGDRAGGGAAAKLDDVDLYALLGITIDATPKEIATAYRRKALKVHPDKNPDDPKAAALFHELSKAYELLSDPTARAAYDGLQRAKLERRKRHEQLDSKRRKLKDVLLEREAAARDQRKQEEEARRTLEERLARLRQEGLARQQEEEERRARELFEQAARAVTPEPDLTAPSILDEVTELDKTLKVKWNPDEHPYTENTLHAALTRFGPVDSLVLSTKRRGTAVVAFESIVDAHAAVTGHATDPQLVGVQLRWALGSEPAIIARLPELVAAAAVRQARTAVRAAVEAVVTADADGAGASRLTTDPELAQATAAAAAATGLRAGTTPPPATAGGSPGMVPLRPRPLFAAFAMGQPSDTTAFAASQAARDYENLTLMRMRQAQERQRLIAEMQKAEAESHDG